MDGNAKYGTCIFMTGNDFDINSIMAEMGKVMQEGWTDHKTG